MRRHTDAIWTLAVTLDVEPKFIHGFIVKCQSTSAFVETVMNWMGRHNPTVVAFTCAKSVFVILKVLTVVRVIDVHEWVESFLCGLPVLSEPSLQVYRVFSFAERSKHEFRRCPCECSARSVAISYHRILIHPHDWSKALYALSLLIPNKVPNEKALANRLCKPIMTLGRASCSAASWTNRRSFISRYRIPTWTFKFEEVYCNAVAFVEFFIIFVSRRLHVVEDVEPPIDCMEVVCVVVRTHVAHPCITRCTHL